MYNILAKTPNEAWIKCCQLANEITELSSNPSYFKDFHLNLSIQNPILERSHELFPMDQNEVSAICEFMQAGKDKNNFNHEWTKIYRKRLFDDGVNQIQNIVELLKKDPYSKRAIVMLWDHRVDFYSKLSPCVLNLWFSLRTGKLELSLQARCTDLYGKLLMNILEFIAVQTHVAKLLNVELGTFNFSSYSCHVLSGDKEKFFKFIKQIDPLK